MVFYEGDSNRTPLSPGTAGFNAAFTDFQGQVRKLVTSGKKVFIVLPTPISDDIDPFQAVNRVSGIVNWNAGITRDDFNKDFAPITLILRKIANATGAQLLDPATELCSTTFCSAFKGKAPIYKDVGHIRPFFVSKYVTVFDDVVLRR